MGLMIGVLGGVVATLDGEPLELPRARERTVLAALALAHPAPVPVQELIDALWGADGGGTAQTVRSYVSRLRHVLGPEHLTSTSAGYALSVPAEAIDANRAGVLLAEATAAAGRGDHDTARTAAESALSLWRATPYRELATPAADDARVHLERLRGDAVAVLGEALMGLGRPARAAEVLAPACRAAPLEEPLWALWIRALHADGRRDEALRRYDEVRRSLSAELGIDPGTHLREVHRAVLYGTGAQGAVERRMAIRQGYANSGSRAVAYVVIDGSGPPLLFLHGMFLPSEMLLEERSAADFVRRLADGRRLVMLDPGGIGLSDPVEDAEISYEVWAQDTAAVLRAVAIRHCDVLAMGFGLGQALHLAVDDPDRVGRLVIGSAPAAPHLSGLRLEDALAQIDAGEAGEGGSVRFLAPSRADDADFSAWLDRAARRGARPAAARAFYRMMFAADLLSVAAQVTQSALVIERRGAAGGGAEALALATALPQATHVVLDGADALPFVGDVQAWLEPVEAFLDDAPLVHHGRLMAVAATAAVAGTVVVSVHDLPDEALAAASARMASAEAACRAVVDAGVVWPGDPPAGPAVRQARDRLATAPVGVIIRTAAFEAVSQGGG